jgi:phage baseplate assembly protein W
LATITQIKSPVWAYSILGGGAISEGLSAIRQCIDIILRTTKGSDPLRPEFGSDVYTYQDAPVNIAIPNIKKSILEALNTWEPRVTVQKVNHIGDVSKLEFEVVYTLNDGTISDSIIVTIGSSGIVTGIPVNRLILQGFVPPNPSNFQFQVKCILDGSPIVPAPPDSGFGDVLEMFQWVKDNWLNYGQWYLTAEGLVGYMVPSFRTGSLTVSLLTKNRFQGLIPSLPIGYKYHISVDVDGTVHENDSDLFTAGQLRQWAEDNLGELGMWQLVSLPGSFSEDFSEDFQLYLQLLVVYTSQANNVVITITTEES